MVSASAYIYINKYIYIYIYLCVCVKREMIIYGKERRFVFTVTLFATRTHCFIFSWYIESLNDDKKVTFAPTRLLRALLTFLRWRSHRLPFIQYIMGVNYPYPEPVAIQWQSSGNLGTWNVDPSVKWNSTGEIIVGSLVAGVFPVCFQWSPYGLPVVIHCVPIVMIHKSR